MASIRLMSRRLAGQFRFAPRTVHTQPSTTVPLETADGYKSQGFQDYVSSHRQHARNSVLVKVQSRYALIDLHNYCIKYGDVKKIMHYHLSSVREYALVEFEDGAALRGLLSECQYGKEKLDLPVFSRLLQFHPDSHNEDATLNAPFEFFSSQTETELESHLLSSTNISKQMQVLYSIEKLNNIGVCLRFFICTQIEDMLKGLSPHCFVLPFGSSVNGLGRNFCDLDMVLSFQKPKQEKVSPMSFEVKRTAGSERMQSQRLLETLGDNLQTLLPGVSSVLRILQARVPILKFKHDATDIHCDFTVRNESGYEMAAILYTLGELDPRFRPLVFVIRKWAQINNITNDSPGRWFTNFQLIVMVLFFLQKRAVPILPSLDDLFRDDLKGNMQHQAGNSEELEELLKEFFLFYEVFDYKEKAISITSADTFYKPDYSALYVQNPLEKEHNVTKNVDTEMVKKLKACAQNALWILDSSDCNKKSRYGAWGIVRLFEKTDDAAISKNRMKKFHVTALFDKVKKNVVTKEPLTVNPEVDIPAVTFATDSHVQKIADNVYQINLQKEKLPLSVNVKPPKLKSKPQKASSKKAGKS